MGADTLEDTSPGLRLQLLRSRGDDRPLLPDTAVHSSLAAADGSWL